MISITTIVVSAGIALLLALISIWSKWKCIRDSTALTATQKTVLGFQLLCTFLFPIVALFWLFWPGEPFDNFLPILIPVPFIVFIGITSIVYRVSIYAPTWSPGPAAATVRAESDATGGQPA